MLNHKPVLDIQSKKSNEQLAKTFEMNSLCNGNEKPVRIYIDGCWDVMHSGHYNAIRQAKALGDVLVVGVHSDEEIGRNKRQPVMNDEERTTMVEACKWTDEVVFDVPYSPTIALMDRCDIQADFIAHGDDIPHDASGHSAYAGVMSRLKIFKRTPGVSTTMLIERLLLALEDNDNNNNNNNNNDNDNNNIIYTNTSANINAKMSSNPNKEEREEINNNVIKSWSQFLATSHRLSAFSNHLVPQDDDIVVYIDGSWDLFHPGHVAALKKAKSLGTFLYVGLYDDMTIREKQGKYWPIMSLQERMLNVLSCRYVDEVVIGCPWVVSRDMVNALHIRVLAISKNNMLSPNDLQRYEAVKEFVSIKTLTNLESNLKTQDLIERIIKDNQKYCKQNESRVKKELKYITEREYVEET